MSLSDDEEDEDPGRACSVLDRPPPSIDASFHADEIVTLDLALASITILVRLLPELAPPPSSC
jgi:hypothetical protein